MAIRTKAQRTVLPQASRLHAPQQTTIDFATGNLSDLRKVCRPGICADLERAGHRARWTPGTRRQCQQNWLRPNSMSAMLSAVAPSSLLDTCIRGPPWKLNDAVLELIPDNRGAQYLRL